MIFVDGLPFVTDNSSHSQGSDTLVALLEHPTLVSASSLFKTMQERKFSVLEDSDLQSSARRKWVYVFQREYATVNPALVDFVGTDEATTCVGVVIRNQKNGMISIAHMDSPNVVDIGLSQMLLSLLVDQDSNVDLDVHLIGGFKDIASEYANGATNSTSFGKVDGYSLPLCTKLIETLRMGQQKFHIRTLFVLGHNTKRDALGNSWPVFNGFLVETSSGSLTPACFDRTTRCPDEIVRRIRVTASYEDPGWEGKLLETYDPKTDRFVISPCSWSMFQLQVALTLQNLSDEEILLECSTSPSAEGPDFVDNLRRQWDYLMKHRRWQDTFAMKQPRIFERSADGEWRRCLSPQQSYAHEPVGQTSSSTS